MAEKINYSPQVREALEAIVEMVIVKFISEINPGKAVISQRKAYHDFGRAWVKQALKLGLTERRRRGKTKNSTVCYSRVDLYAILATEKANKANIFTGTIDGVKVTDKATPEAVRGQNN